MVWLYIFGALILLLVLFFLRSSYERRTLSVSEYRIASQKLPRSFDGMVLVYLADLHDCFFGEGNEQLIRKIREQKPDVLLVGGDMTSAQTSIGRMPLKALECILKAFPDIPVYYSFGNHETRIFSNEQYAFRRASFTNLLKENQVILLNDRCEKLIRGDSSIEVCGIDLDRRYYRRGKKMPLQEDYIEKRLGPSREGFKILLCHSPLYMKELTSWGADVVLSGHFHGGTIYLPLLGGLMTPQYQFFSPYCRGKVKCEKGLGVVSGGLGTHSINIRFNNKPDIVKLILKREESA